MTRLLQIQNICFDAFDEIIFFDYFRHEPHLNDNVFHFGHQPDIAAGVQEKIDWTYSKDEVRRLCLPLHFLLSFS